MAATVIITGSYQRRIQAITLARGAVETVAHGLGVTPEVLGVVVTGMADTATFRGCLGLFEVPNATFITAKNFGEDTISGLIYIQKTHSLIK